MADNLTRREFLKDLGLLGAGVTLAPGEIVGSSIIDWDDEKTAGVKRPAWVKTVGNPTTEIDWGKMKRYDERLTLRHEPQYIPKERYDKLVALQAENLSKFLKANKAGYTLRDVALQAAVGNGKSPTSFILDPKGVTTPEKRGVARWTGTPEDAAQMVTAAMRHMGAATIGYVPLETETTEKLIYGIDPDGKENLITDVDMPAENDKQRIIPKKARWVIVFTVQMSQETLKRAPVVLGAQTTNLTYTRAANIQVRLQYFLMSLGYMALAGATTNSLGIAPAFGVMGGLGELSRYNRLITPEYGPMVRVFRIVTDLPLAPSKPIDAGLNAFCKACKKCAEACPSKALSFETEPTWDVKGGWNNSGHKAWYEDSVKCRNYWFEVGTNCGICFAVCPFASKNLAFMNSFRNAMASNVPVFDGVLKTLDDVLYGNPGVSGVPQKDITSWWKLDLPEYGIDSTQGHRDGYA
ncbi:MAG: reductive dehalogenase [Chloroflexi bacterium]|nr:reductive dehalogenase [Chloroflexota bacterium]